jgi:predicted RNA methylase
LLKKSVVDLGCGTGRFTLPIAKFFANFVLGVDSDFSVIDQLKTLKDQHKLNVNLLNTSIEFLEPFQWSKSFQTAIMNPPFGTRRRGIDQVFLKKALAFSQVVLSIHKTSSKSREIWNRLAEIYLKKAEVLATFEFPILKTFQFHRKEQHYVMIDLIRIGPV